MLDWSRKYCAGTTDIRATISWLNAEADAQIPTVVLGVVAIDCPAFCDAFQDQAKEVGRPLARRCL